MNMKISIEKLKLVRPYENPKNTNLELDANWKIEYKKISSNSFGYICHLKMEGEFSISLIVEGIVEFEENINIILDNISQTILDRLFQILVNMINLTKETHIELDINDIKDSSQVKIPAYKVAS